MAFFDKTLRAPDLSVDRRRFIVGAATLSATAAWPFRLWAAETPHTFKQGDFEITVLSDGSLTLPANLLGPDTPAEERKAFLDMVGITGENVTGAASPVLIRAGSDVILFDNGSGSGFQPTSGKLLENMAAAGIDPASVTRLVFTHGHPDHMWGTAVEGGSNFPNATYYSGAVEWDFWNAPDILTKMPQDMHGMVTTTQSHYAAVKDKVTRINPGDEIVTGIRAFDTAGHTPGHLSFEIAGGEGLILTADALTFPTVFFPHPEWKFGFDAVHDLAIAARKSLLDRAATDKIKLIGYHWPYPGIGYAEKKDGAYQYVPEA
jgi:glyoxylase-like metal-dependent hydrolase (beta-lactamase superfamily II)